MLSQYTIISCQRKPDYIKQQLTRKHCIGYRFLCCLQTGKGVQYCCADRASLPPPITKGMSKHFCNKRLMQQINTPWQFNEDI